MYQYRGTLHGLLVTHVDDFLWGGSHVFVENVFKPLHKISRYQVIKISRYFDISA